MYLLWSRVLGPIIIAVDLDCFLFPQEKEKRYYQTFKEFERKFYIPSATMIVY